MFDIKTCSKCNNSEQTNFVVDKLLNGIVPSLNNVTPPLTTSECI